MLNLNNYKAKPTETIEVHNNNLAYNANLLFKNNYIDDSMFRLLLKSIYGHDLGKMTKLFQKRVSSGSKMNTKLEVFHNILSPYLINPEDYNNKEDYHRSMYSIINHHSYVTQIAEYINNNKSLIESNLEGFKTYNITKRTLGRILDMQNDNKTILLKGFLNKCDYAASGHYTIEKQPNFLNSGLKELLLSFGELAIWNNMQNFCIENQDENIMITAQTGMGKTEGGLLWIGDNKGFFILPLKAPINAIYKRLQKNIVKDNIQEKVGLLHSDNLSYFVKNVNEVEDSSCYKNQCKNLSLPLNISTLDQLFDFVYKYPGYEIKLSTLAYSKIVVDEIQMYDPKLLAHLIIGLEKIIEFGGKVAIFTATLSPFVKDLLSKNIHFKEGTYINSLQRHNIKVIKSEIDSDFIYDKYKEVSNQKDSAKFLIICNTVKQAQKVYQDLSKREGIEDINILHSKFIRKDRRDLEDRILKVGNKNVKSKCIWITTPVVEASLDIDFDYIFTELQDLNSLFQRLGRGNRAGTKSVKDYNCFVFTEIDTKLLINKKRGFIDPDMYYLSKEALDEVDGILNEQNKLDLINKYFTTERLNKSNYLKTYRDTYNELSELYSYQANKKDVKLRDINTESIVPIKVYYDNKDEINNIIEDIKKYNELIKDKAVSDSNKIIYKNKIVLLKDEINDFTLSIERYEIKNELVFKKIDLSRFETIKIYHCQYDEMGYRRFENSLFI